MEQVLVVTNLGHVSWRHGVRGENWPTQVGGPQVIGAQCLLLGFTMWRERPGLFCNNTNRALSQTSTNPRSSSCHHYRPRAHRNIPANIKLWKIGRFSRVLAKGLPSTPIPPYTPTPTSRHLKTRRGRIKWCELQSADESQEDEHMRQDSRRSPLCLRGLLVFSIVNKSGNVVFPTELRLKVDSTYLKKHTVFADVASA